MSKRKISHYNNNSNKKNSEGKKSINPDEIIIEEEFQFPANWKYHYHPECFVRFIDSEADIEKIAGPEFYKLRAVSVREYENLMTCFICDKPLNAMEF